MSIYADSASYITATDSFLTYQDETDTINGVNATSPPSRVLASDGRGSTSVDYIGFLSHISPHDISFIRGEDLVRSENAYGTGATMSVYPGTWRQVRDQQTTPNLVALKYINVTRPQGASTIPAFVDSMNWRLDSIRQELDVLAGKEGRYHRSFPRLLGISWEEVASPARLRLYRPIMVVEAAVSNLESYIRTGSHHGTHRSETEKRFISSILTAMNFLHQECSLVHGDLKPANILVFRDPETAVTDVKLADFGLSYDVSAYAPEGSKFDIPAGTEYWAAPEAYPEDIFHGTSLYPFTRDYYSFGLVIWFILFGYPIGDMEKGITPEDERNFKFIKQGELFGRRSSTREMHEILSLQALGTVVDMARRQFASHWKWEIVDPGAIEELEALQKQYHEGDESSSEEESKEFEEIQGDLMEKLVLQGKITEFRWDTVTSAWVKTDDHFHHVYQALVETALQRLEDDRRGILHKTAEELITHGVSWQLAAFSVLGDPDPKKNVFGSWNFRHGPSGLRFFEIQMTRKWNEKREQHENKNHQPPLLTDEVVNSLPISMAEELLQVLIQQASNESLAPASRHAAAANIRTFRERLPRATDYASWYRQQIRWSSTTDRLRYVVQQKLLGRPIDSEEADKWVLEGITTLPGRPTELSLLDVFKTVDRSVLNTAIQCALWDYVTETGVNEPADSDCTSGTLPPIFQSIREGDERTLTSLAALSVSPLNSMVHNGCDLLHFAIICRQLGIMRQLMLDYGFVIGDGEGYVEVIKSLLFDPDAASTLIEMDSCYVMAKRRVFTRNEIDNYPSGPVQLLFQPGLLELITEAGSQSFMAIIDGAYRNPLSLCAMSYATSDGDNETKSLPLLAALRTRRLLSFLKLLEWGRPTRGRPTFSPDVVVEDRPILCHAIVSMAPFFVAALLHKGADPNLMSLTDEGYELSPLFMGCSFPSRHYKASLTRRKELHDEMGCLPQVLEEDEHALANFEEDCEALRKVIVLLLLQHGADVNQGIRVAGETDAVLMTPLVHSIMKKDVASAILFIDHNADLNPRTSAISPLHHAILADLPDVFTYLLEHGASPDGAGVVDAGPPLFTSVLCNRLDMFKELLSKGASLAVEVPDSDGELAFHTILEHTSEHVLRDMVPEDLAAALQAASAGSLEELLPQRRKFREALVAHLKSMAPADLRALVNRRSRDGRDALFFAAEYVFESNEEDIELLDILFSNADNVARRLDLGFTALERAIVVGNLQFTVYHMGFALRGLGVR